MAIHTLNVLNYENIVSKKSIAGALLKFDTQLVNPPTRSDGSAHPFAGKPVQHFMIGADLVLSKAQLEGWVYDDVTGYFESPLVTIDQIEERRAGIQADSTKGTGIKTMQFDL